MEQFPSSLHANPHVGISSFPFMNIPLSISIREDANHPGHCANGNRSREKRDFPPLWNKTTISAERQSTPNDSRVFETGNLPCMLPSAQDSSHMLPAATLVPANKKPSEPAARLDESDRVRWENVISSVSTRTPLRPFQGKHATLTGTTSMMSCVYSGMRMGRRSYKGRLADFSSADSPIPFFAAGWDSFFRLLVRTLGQNRLLAWHPFPLLMTIAAVRRLFAKQAEQQQPR